MRAAAFQSMCPHLAPPPFCYTTAMLQIHPPTELKLTNFNDTRMGVSRGGRAGFSYMILIK